MRSIPATRTALNCYRFSLLGETGVGKTSLATRFALEYFDEGCYGATIEDSYRKQLIVDDILYLVEVFDVQMPPADTLELRDAYIRNSQGFGLVYSVASRSSFDRIPHFYELARRLKGEDIVAVIVGNKCDKSSHRVVETSEGVELAQRLGCAFIETSAKTGENVGDLLSNLIRVLRHLVEQTEPLSANESHRRGDKKGDRNVISALLSRLRRR